MRQPRPYVVSLLSALLLASLSTPAPSAIDDFEAHPMYADPVISVPPSVNAFDPGLPELWLAALDRPDVDTRRQAAEAIATGLTLGMAHLESTRAPLIRLLQSPNAPLRIAAAHALISFNDPSLGPVLLGTVSTANDDPELQLTIDPALARWNTAGAADLLIKRLAASDARTQGRLSAIVSLGILKSSSAVTPLRAIVTDAGVEAPLRLAAARSLCQIDPDSVAVTGKTLLGADSPMLNRLLAATLLSSASGQAAQSLLLTLARDSEPAVVTIAAQRLFEMDPRLLAPLSSVLRESSDNTVRLTLARALLVEHTPEAADVLLDLLGDPSLVVRSTARGALTELDADAALRSHLRSAAISILDGAEPHAIAESLEYLASVHETAAAGKAVEDLGNTAHEVRIAAIIALRRFAIPETVEPQRQRMESLLRAASRKYVRPEELAGVDEELAQLIENMGLVRDLGSENFLLGVLPMKGGPLLRARVAAAWSLGKLHAGGSTPRVAGALLGRLRDQDPQHPESADVQAMAAVGLGLLQSREALSTLQIQGSGSALDASMHWAVAQITSQPLVPLPPRQRRIQGWFLEPLPPATSEVGGATQAP